MPCIRPFSEKDGILIFDSELDAQLSTYEAHHLEKLMEAETSHFWFSNRRDKIGQLFQQRIPKKSRILEIGGGTGYVAAKLIELGYSIEESDIHLNGLLYAKKRGIKKLMQFDLFSPPFIEEFDCICLFDVLEHLHEEQRALESLRSMLKPGGFIVLTVPAHQWLWNRDDVIAGHCRRYSQKHLETVFRSTRFETVHLQYFFIAILPFLILRKWVNRDTGCRVAKSESVAERIPSFFNKICNFLTKTEFYFERYLPNKIGGTLIAIAQKPLIR